MVLKHILGLKAKEILVSWSLKQVFYGGPKLTKFKVFEIFDKRLVIVFYTVFM